MPEQCSTHADDLAREEATPSFRELFESSPERQVLIAADAPRFSILAASDPYLELVTKNRDELIGEPLFQIFPETDDSEQPLLRAALELSLETGTPQSLAAYRYDLPDPEAPDKPVERYWSPSLHPHRNEDHEVIAVLFRIEEATDFVLRERFIYQRHLSQVRGDRRRRSVLILDPDLQRRTFMAQALSTYWHVANVSTPAQALDELQTQHYDVVVTSMEIPDGCGFKLIEEIKERTRSSVIARVKQTSPRLFEAAFKAGADDVIAGPASAREFMARIQTQLTEITLREITFQGVQLQYHQLFMEAPVAISVLEKPDLVYTLANPALYEIVGDRQLIGVPVREAFPEPEIQESLDHLEEVYRTGEPYFASELPFIPAGGDQVRHVTFSYQPFRDPDGEIRGVASFASDVTREVEMRHAVMRENERKDIFLAMLGHELRNPLAPIAHANEIIRHSIDQADPETLRWATETIGRQVDQLKHHVDELLDVARLKRGQINIERTPVKIQDMITNAVATVRAAVGRRNQHLTIDVPEKPITVEVDAARITQVLTNLLDNASKYTPPGGHIWLRSRLSDSPDQGDKKHWTLEVIDDGQGIDASLLPDLFELFTQADKSLDRSRGGLGLGLALVQGIVEMHGGIVHARSRGPGKGSTFTIELPVDATIPEIPDQTPRPAPLQGMRVLIVDDLPDVTEAMARLLELRGATVFVANSGADAIRIATEVGPSHILVDIGLPDMDGYQVVRRLRELPETRHTIIAALTGYGLPSDHEKTRAAGFDEHLTKPAGLSELVDFLTTSSHSSAPGP